MRLLILVAMQSEAQPIINWLGLQSIGRFFRDFPFEVYLGHLGKGDIEVTLVTSGIDDEFKVDNVATQNMAAMLTVSICHFYPDAVINAGTAGGFTVAKESIGDVFLINDFIYHVRRIPIPGFDRFGIGGYHLEFPESTLSGFPKAVVSTGNSLSITKEELKKLLAIASVRPVVKDMEAATIAEICSRAGLPCLSLKSVTDLVDGNQATEEQFLANLRIASAKLLVAVIKLLENITQGNLKEFKWSRNHELIEKIL